MKFEGMERLDLNPEFLEVQAAKAVFLERLRYYAQFTRPRMGHKPDMHPETAVACALAEVWRQGRKYQRDQDREVLWELAQMERDVYR